MAITDLDYVFFEVPTSPYQKNIIWFDNDDEIRCKYSHHR